MKKIDGGVTEPKGFQAAGIEAGIKYQNRRDMALVYTETKAVAAGTFTTNVVKAAPVLWDQQLIKEGKPIHAVVLNSGIANAATGEEGRKCNYQIASAMAEELKVAPEEVLTASTGVIGVQIPMKPIQKGVKLLRDALKDSREAASEAAHAIMTTDTQSKECAVEFEINGKVVRVGGMSKGSGMIHPNMATMLSVITTDAQVEKKLLQETLLEVVQDSFNMISVDRDTSTNDTCVILANGMSGVSVIEKDTEAYEKFREALSYVATDLAKQMAGDGEGCTRLLEVKVIHATDKEAARKLSKAVITSNLVKTAVYGQDANWGRIMCALGYAGVDFDAEKTDVVLYAQVDGKEREVVLVRDGMDAGFSEEEATLLLGQKKTGVCCDMKQGEASATAWGCDLTYEYVKINGDYRS